jgi:hypothetical protein
MMVKAELTGNSELASSVLVEAKYTNRLTE